MIDQAMSLVLGVFQSFDVVSLVAALLILLLLGLAMRAYGNVINMTILALVLFVVVSAARSLLGFGVEQKPLGVLPQHYWDGAMALSLGQFLVYFVAFAVVLTVVYLVKSVARR